MTDKHVYIIYPGESISQHRLNQHKIDYLTLENQFPPHKKKDYQAWEAISIYSSRLWTGKLTCLVFVCMMHLLHLMDDVEKVKLIFTFIDIYCYNKKMAVQKNLKDLSYDELMKIGKKKKQKKIEKLKKNERNKNWLNILKRKEKKILNYKRNQ